MTVKDVQARYDSDAAAYEKWWAPVLRRNMQPVLDSIDWADVQVALELGCGTGGVLDDLAARAPKALTVGLDATFGMLSRAPRSHARVQGDAQRLPFEDSSVDVVISGFMVHHLDRPDLTLLEVRRVLRPGGQLRIATWGGPIATWEGDEIYTEELNAVGAAPTAPSVQPGRTLSDNVDKLLALAAAAGFEAEAVSRDLDWHPDADEVFGQLTAMRGTARRFATLSPDDARTVENRVRARLESADIGSWRPYEVLILSGKRVNLRHN